MIAFDGNNFLGSGMGNPNTPTPKGNQSGITQSALQNIAMNGGNTSIPVPPPTPTTPQTPPVPPFVNPGMTYNPYQDDYKTYGQRPEWTYWQPQPQAFAKGGYVNHDTALAHVTPGEIMLPPEFHSRGVLQAIRREMHKHGADPRQYIVGGGGADEINEETGLPQYGFWKTIKNIVKDVAPVAIGLGASALTGSDIAGGLASGLTSKLFGNDWMTAGLTGLGTGIAGNVTGISGNSSTGGVGGMFDSALDWAKDNPGTTALGAGAAGLALLSALKNNKVEDTAMPDTPAGFNDPKYAQQIRDGGWQLDRTYNDPNQKINWYQYGQLPEWDFFNNENDFHAVPKKRGGAIPGGKSVGSALTQLHDAGGMADGPGGGQDDKIPVYLSAKEYVMPADVVSDLGDGNPDEGARKLDKMRDKVRTHKGRRGFPKAAKKNAEGYL